MPLTAYEYNRIGLGATMAGESRPPAGTDTEAGAKPHIFYAPSFTYERILKEHAYGFSTWEINVYANPFENNCSLSFAVKFFLPDILLPAFMKTDNADKVMGWFVGLSPLSDVNFYNFFAAEPYLYYGVGCSLGWYFVIANVFDFEMELSMSLGIFDSPVFGKMNFSLSAGYWF